MRRVLIGTPAHTGQVDCWYADALFESGRVCTAQDIHLSPILITGDSNLCNARNDLVALAIRTPFHDERGVLIQQGFDDLIFIDADQDWKPEWIPKLLGYPVDCVGAAIQKKSDREELYNVRAPEGPLSFQHNPEYGLWTAPDMCLGTGFLRLSRGALQALWDAAEPYSNGKGKEPSRWIFDFRPVNGELVGEDTLLCMKLREMGFDIWLDPTMNPGHIGAKKWVPTRVIDHLGKEKVIGDFANWLGRAQEQARTAQGKVA